jgi:hypothetical protein
MSFVAVCQGILGAGLALALTVVAGLASAAPADQESKDKATTPTEKIRQALDQPIALDITEQPLTQALNKIREQTKINFVVDRMLIQQMGYDPEQMPVSAKLKDAKARTCLRSVLSPYNLGYAIIGDTVLISTDDMVMQRQMKQRVTVDLDKVDLAAALKQLSRETATNLLLDSRVPVKEGKTTVTLQLEDVPLDTAIKLVAEAGGLKPVQVGNVMLVTTKALANEMRNDPELMTAAQTPQQEIQMLQQRRMLMMQQQQLAPQIFQPVQPPPPPPAEKTGEEKKADPPTEGEKKGDKPDGDKQPQ